MSVGMLLGVGGLVAFKSPDQVARVPTRGGLRGWNHPQKFNINNIVDGRCTEIAFYIASRGYRTTLDPLEKGFLYTRRRARLTRRLSTVSIWRRTRRPARRTAATCFSSTRPCSPRCPWPRRTNDSSCPSATPSPNRIPSPWPAAGTRRRTFVSPTRWTWRSGRRRSGPRVSSSLWNKKFVQF